jgi:hypothetical protein
MLPFLFPNLSDLYPLPFQQTLPLIVLKRRRECKLFLPAAPKDDMMMPGSKGQKAVHACMIRLLNLGPAKHEKVAIYVVNQRISNVCRIAGAASQRSNS